jgi:hypothetical protein
LYGTSLGGILRELKMLKGHLPRVTYHRAYFSIRRENSENIQLETPRVVRISKSDARERERE